VPVWLACRDRHSFSGFARLRAMNRLRHGSMHLLRQIRKLISGNRPLLFALLLVCSQQLLLVHAVEHAHSGASITLCPLCAAADFNYLPSTGPTLAAATMLQHAAPAPARLVETAASPYPTSFARAPPLQR
jgi:hypothetical protein